MANNGSNTFGIRDNHTHGKVADFLVEKIAKKFHFGSQLFPFPLHKPGTTELRQKHEGD